MPKPNRLSREDFSHFADTKRYHGTLFSLSASTLPGAEKPKAACVISKKNIGKAHERNLVRRRVREALQPLLSRGTPRAYVLYAKRAAGGASFIAIKEDIKALFSQVS